MPYPADENLDDADNAAAIKAVKAQLDAIAEKLG